MRIFLKIILSILIIICSKNLFAENSFIDTTLPVQFCLMGGKVITNEAENRNSIVIAPTGKMKIINLGKNINSSGVDYAPVISANGKTLYFVSNRVGSKLNINNKPSHDIWAVALTNSKVSDNAKPYNLDTVTHTGNEGLNTPLNEGALSISQDQKKIYFIACNRNDGYGSCDIYYCEIDSKGNWGKPTNLGPNINTKSFETMPSFSPDGNRLYFVSTRLQEIDIKIKDSLTKIIDSRKKFLKDSLYNLCSQKEIQILDEIKINIRELKRFNDSTQQIIKNKLVELAQKFDLNTQYSRNFNLAISYFWKDYKNDSIISNLNKILPNEIEEKAFNIWYSDYDIVNKEWLPSKPLNAINTENYEATPFICSDGKTLFFSSNRKENSKGGKDFYVSRLNDDGTWIKPVNLGEPINTSQDEIFITMPAKSDVVYFSSERKDIPDYQGNLDLFMAYVPLECSTSIKSESKNEKQETKIQKETSTVNATTNDETIKLEFHNEGGTVQAIIELPTEMNVSLKVYDIIGNLKAEIFNAHFNEKGKYIVPISFNKLENGAYFFQLQAGSYSQTQGFVISR